MEDLCHGYNLDRAQGFMASVIPKVVREVLIRCASTMEERQAHATDVEQGGVSQDGVLASRVRQAGTPDNERLQKALVSLCRGYVTNTSLRILHLKYVRNKGSLSSIFNHS